MAPFIDVELMDWPLTRPQKVSRLVQCYEMEIRFLEDALANRPQDEKSIQYGKPIASSGFGREVMKPAAPCPSDVPTTQLNQSRRGQLCACRATDIGADSLAVMTSVEEMLQTLVDVECARQATDTVAADCARLMEEQRAKCQQMHVLMADIAAMASEVKALDVPQAMVAEPKDFGSEDYDSAQSAGSVETLVMAHCQEAHCNDETLDLLHASYADHEPRDVEVEAADQAPSSITARSEPDFSTDEPSVSVAHENAQVDEVPDHAPQSPAWQPEYTVSMVDPLGERSLIPLLPEEEALVAQAQAGVLRAQLNGGIPTVEQAFVGEDELGFDWDIASHTCTTTIAAEDDDGNLCATLSDTDDEDLTAGGHTWDAELPRDLPNITTEITQDAHADLELSTCTTIGIDEMHDMVMTRVMGMLQE
mmetsp:Transcript_54188/g.100119  ORF Transcript_54188/g.100119 Transcript_54188/m.100119 type:complete len:421 (-) Transcript_54188:122-1384(-)